MPARIDYLDPLLNPNPFISSPGDFLAQNVACQMLLVPQFKLVFGGYVDGYLRMDYPERALPVLRIYNDDQQMEADNWFIVGTLTNDVLLPAGTRRNELQSYSDVITNAILQQYRRIPFFTQMRKLVPGLNWLGQSITIKKGLAAKWSEEVMVPLAELAVNFRVDLREWDLYLEANNRTVADPFEQTLADLSRIYTIIAAQNDDGTNAGINNLTQQNV